MPMSGGRDAGRRHGTALFTLFHLAVVQGTGKHSGDVAYLQAYQHHNAFGQHTENTRVMQNGTGKRRKNGHRASRDKIQTRKNRPSTAPKRTTPTMRMVTRRLHLIAALKRRCSLRYLTSLNTY